MVALTVRKWLWSRVRCAVLVWFAAAAGGLVAFGWMLDAGFSRGVTLLVVALGFALAYVPAQARVACPACGFTYSNSFGLRLRFGAPYARTTCCPQCGIALDGPLP